jgi:hypothetical protein
VSDLRKDSYTTKDKNNLIAEFTDWTGAQVEVHGLRDGFAVFVADRLVQKGMNGTDMARYFCHVLESNHRLIASIKPSSPPESRASVIEECAKVVEGLEEQFYDAKRDPHAIAVAIRALASSPATGERS